MYLESIKIVNFKNCRDVELDFSPNINCFIGRNGAGKTNLLDAIYYLSFCKSYFGNLDQQNILHDEHFFYIIGKYNRHEIIETCQCILERGKHKQFKINKKDYMRLSDHIGRYPLVIVSPYDCDLINENNDERRRYIDSVISQFNKNYLNDLIVYNKALIQRNALLKQFYETHTQEKSLLELWDQRMEMPARRIFEARTTFSKSFTSVFQNYYNMIAQSSESVEIEYESMLNKESFLTLMQRSFDKDNALHYTTAGIHKDNLVFKIGGYPVKYFGSQGQQKSFLIAMKLAQFEYIKEKLNIKPILLLDDVFDKLDDERVNQLIYLTGNDRFGQVFITDTQRERVEQIFKKHAVNHKIFTVEQGNIIAALK